MMPPATLLPYDGQVDAHAMGIAHPRPFVCAINVEPASLSRAVDHVSNVEYVRWLDRVAELHADSLGFSRRRMAEQGRMWFVARHEIDYLAEALPGDHLLIATWVRSVVKVKSWRDSTVFRPADGKVICRASTLWVWVDLGTRRPTRIDPMMAERFDPLEPFVAPRGLNSTA